MALECNIDAKGKAVRLLSGIVFILIGFFGLVAQYFELINLPLSTLGGMAMILGGGFAVFEARAGWCALRAMGIKTPI